MANAMIYQMPSCLSMATTMETVRYVFESVAGVFLGVWRITNPFLNLFVILVEEIMWLIVVCVFWLLFFYKLYHPFKLYFQRRHCKARHTKLLNDHMKQSEEEKAAIALHWPLRSSSQTPSQDPEIPSNGVVSGDNLVPVKLPLRASFQTPSQAPEIISNSGVSGDNLVLVPVKLCCTCTLSCRWMSCKRKLKKLASKVRAPRQPVTSVETKSGCVAVQTQLHLNAETEDKLSRIAARKLCGEVTVQLGRWRACCLVDGEVKPMDIDECDSSDQRSRVPVLFNASFKADTLTVEGLNLANATIYLVYKHGECVPLETECMGESEPGVAVSTGAGRLETHTCMPELPEGSMSIAEFSVIAFKRIIKDGNEVTVSSLPVQIQDDSLRIVLRDILPSTVIVFFAVKQILSSVGFATLIVAWLMSFMIVALTSTLPESTETMIQKLLAKMAAHIRIFYEVYRTYRYNSVDDEDDLTDEEDAGGSELDEEDIADDNLPKDMRAIKGKAAEDDPKTDGDQSCSAKAKAEGEAESNSQGSRFVHCADWQWPIYDTVRMGDQSRLQLRKESITEIVDRDAMKIPFEVIYLNIKHLPWASQVQVDISSPFLKSLLPVDTDRWKSCKKKVKVDGPELFRNYTTLTAHRASCVAKLESLEPATNAEDIREELQHITHLVRFMKKEFEDIALMYAAMKTQRQVTWEMLWAFLPPEERVVYVDDVTDECVCGKVLWTQYKVTDQDPILLVRVTKWDYNCQSWNEYTNKVTVPAFSGDREIKGLSIRPLCFEEDPEATESSFLDRGKRFSELSMMQSNCYMKYKGSLVSYVSVDRCLRIVKENADGRVMIDLGSFSKMNPDYPLGSAKPPCEIIRDNITIRVDVTGDPNRMFAPSFVYGFSFRLKKWGCFSVAGFTDIEFNDSAYDELVMNPATKDLTYSLVQERLKEGSKKDGPQAKGARVDPIANKGDGCILLCYGPPGTGKTLTAESLSEKLHRPLWCLNVFELGVTPAALETMLVKVLDIAASWGAILLLDEADVYLERRSSKDLVRNSMTGVFLRHLEYYRGVLFLTTNRDAAFDEAICSRITMFLHFGRHDECQRNAIWKTLFRRLGLEDCTSEILAEFSKPDFNGREITKIVKTAQTLAKSKGQRLEFHHVRDALQVYEESSKLRASLNSSTGASTLPAHQQPTKQLLEKFSSSSSPELHSKLHSSSTVTSADVGQDVRPLELSLSSNFDPDTVEETQSCESSGNETPTSDQWNGTMEAVTPTSETCKKTTETVTPTSDQCHVAIETGTPTSKCSETIEAVTPVSSSNTINHVPTSHDCYYLT